MNDKLRSQLHDILAEMDLPTGVAPDQANTILLDYLDEFDLQQEFGLSTSDPREIGLVLRDQTGEVQLAENINLPNLKFRFREFMLALGQSGVDFAKAYQLQDKQKMLTVLGKFVLKVGMLSRQKFDQAEVDILVAINKLYTMHQGPVKRSQLDSMLAGKISADDITKALSNLLALSTLTIAEDETNSADSIIDFNEVIYFHRLG